FRLGITFGIYPAFGFDESLSLLASAPAGDKFSSAAIISEGLQEFGGVGIGGLRPGFGGNTIDGGGVEDAKAVVGGGFARAAGVDGLRAALFQRGIVEERVGAGVENLVGEGRRLR